MFEISPEVYDAVVTQFEISKPFDIDLSRSGRDTNPGCVLLSHYLDEPKGVPDVKALRNLRLTSRAFSEAATRVLFRSCFVRWQPANTSKLPDLIYSIAESDGGIFNFVKKLQLSFLPLAYGFRDDFQLPDKFGVDWPPKGNQTRLLIEALPNVLNKLSRLQRLEICMPSWASEHDGGEGDGLAPHLDLPFLAHTTQCIADTLSTSKFEHLTHLQLTLPCTYDFVELSQIVPDSFWERLKHLSLGITDATGPGGSKKYLYWADEDGDGDEGFPFSNLQEQYSNTEHAHGIFDIVARCPNLESLGLSGTQFLDGNLLDWKPTSVGLKSIFLSRVKFSMPNLIKLLSPAEHIGQVGSALTKIWFEEVDLTSGLWGDVFVHLCTCPDLLYFNPENLSYARGGESIQFRSWHGRQWEDTSSLWSICGEDEIELETLVELLVAKAGGRHKYPSTASEQLVLGYDGIDD